jgi:hypothetical protein
LFKDNSKGETIMLDKITVALKERLDGLLIKLDQQKEEVNFLKKQIQKNTRKINKPKETEVKKECQI